MSEYGENGKQYVQWCAQLAESYKIGVPWVMCQQSDAPDPIVMKIKKFIIILFECYYLMVIANILFFCCCLRLTHVMVGIVTNFLLTVKANQRCGLRIGLAGEFVISINFKLYLFFIFHA